MQTSKMGPAGRIFFGEAKLPRLATADARLGAATTRSFPDTAGMSFEAASAARFELIYACLAGMDACRAEVAQMRPCFLAGAETLFLGQAAATVISGPDAAATALSVPDAAATALSVPDAAATALSVPDAAATAISVPDAAVTAISVPDAEAAELAVPDVALTVPSVPDAAVTALSVSDAAVTALHGPGPPSLPLSCLPPYLLPPDFGNVWKPFRREGVL
ncbi:hypothetical protein M9458_055896, partial [Cirrhinus mrigala]